MDKLDLATPESLCGLAAGMAGVGHTPPTEWIKRFCLHAYTKFSNFNAQVGVVVECPYKAVTIHICVSFDWKSHLSDVKSSQLLVKANLDLASSPMFTLVGNPALHSAILTPLCTVHMFLLGHTGACQLAVCPGVFLPYTK